MHFVVVVLGDLGRSPRMQYHCQSLLDAGHTVSFVGYTGEALIDSLQHDTHHHRLHVVRFHPLDITVLRPVPVLYFVARVVVLTLWLSYALMVSVGSSRPSTTTPQSVPPPIDFVLLQNPPALPLLLVSYLYCRLKGLTQNRRPGLIIDWHNLGYSMFRDGSLVQKIAKWYELTVAPWANGHFTVTRAMKDYLATIGITKNVQVLYDQPADTFVPFDDAEQVHQLMLKLESKTKNPVCRTTLTVKTETEARFRPGRPALVVSSTSWTPDEDFGVLLEALERVDQKIAASNDHLSIFMIVTGKGPQREYYDDRISRLKMEHVAVATVWLDPGDYPKLLACADVGVSMHTSTSGLDLPMKILDLFGCNTPVLAHRFACIDELVQDGVNGRIFDTSQELADQLYEVLQPLTDSTKSVPNHSYGDLKTYSENLDNRGQQWSTNWSEHALPVIMLSTPM